MECLYSLPSYQQVAIMLAVGTFLLCLFCYLYGSLFCSMPRLDKELPAVPLFPDSAFPNFWDKTYTLLFSAGYTVMIVGSITEKTVTQIGLVVVLSTLIIYVPMIVRLAFLKTTVPQKNICLKALACIVCSMVVLGLFCSLMEMVHLPQWISNTTKCPLEQDVVDFFRKGGNYGKLMVFISACLVAPVGEECFFRGFLYNILKGKAGAVAAALCSSLYFGAIHGALVQFIPLALFGLVQCHLYERFRTLMVPMIFHCCFNALSLSLVFFDVLPS